MKLLTNVYKYKIATFEAPTDHELVQYLNDLSEHGWELVTMAGLGTTLHLCLRKIVGKTAIKLRRNNN